MGDQRLVETLALNFATKTFAYIRLAQSLNRSVSDFLNCLREYLDPAVKADQCAQYVDDIGIASNSTKGLIRNIRAVFQCISQAELKLTVEKCQFGVIQFESLARRFHQKEFPPKLG